RGLLPALGHPGGGGDPRWGRTAGGPQPGTFEALGSLLDAASRTWKTRELLPRLVAEQVAAGAVLSLEEVLEDAQIRHNGAVLEREHPAAGRMREPRPPVRFEKTPAEAGRPAPLLGEHSDEVLAELGLG